MGFLKVADAKIYFEIEDKGKGPWLTLVNGYTRSLKDFKLLRKQLLSHGYRLLFLDNRESGQSSSESHFDISDMYQDIVQLWDHLKIGQCYILGISMGGVIAQALAMNEPKRVLGMILISTFADSTWLKQIEVPWSLDEQENTQRLRTYVSNSFWSRNMGLLSLMAKQITYEAQNGVFLQRAKRQREALSDYYVSAEELNGISCPVVLIHGTEDGVIDSCAAEYLQEHLPQSHLEFLESGGHLLLVEKSQDLWTLIHSYLEGWR